MINVKLKIKVRYLPLILCLYLGAKLNSKKMIRYSINNLVEKEAFFIKKK
nr:MAG TPA: hypothetical protein [Caudoviricetes sp.]